MLLEEEIKREMTTYYNNGASTTVSAFMRGSGVAEYHAIIKSTAAGENFAAQLSTVIAAYNNLRERLGAGVVPVFKRYFLSDASNQQSLLPREEECAVSIVEQSPLDGTKLALWVYLQEGVAVNNLYNGLYSVTHGDYTHFWQGSACTPDVQSEVATRALLCDYALRLEDEGCSIADNCVRTWFFVHDVDVNYAGMVKGRNEMFMTNNLTSDTHFIASTGIGGRHADPRVTVEMDTYAVKGIVPGQMRYLYAPEYLNPTYEYGVAFERGTYVDYGDRRHVFISGTASINNRGEVVHKGDVKAQTRRMWENVGALLAEAECGWHDVCHMIVYLRDIADYAAVNAMYEERFPGVPRVIVLAPVCRPEWLIEMECMAVRPVAGNGYAAF